MRWELEVQKKKFRGNIEAISLLKKLEAENRLATPEEQKILSRYVGWGGLSAVFDDRKEEWSKEYQELKNLLSESEYKEARSSTLNAFYTPPTVIKAMYQILEIWGYLREMCWSLPVVWETSWDLCRRV